MPDPANVKTLQYKDTLTGGIIDGHADRHRSDGKGRGH